MDQIKPAPLMASARAFDEPCLDGGTMKKPDRQDAPRDFGESAPRSNVVPVEKLNSEVVQPSERGHIGAA